MATFEVAYYGPAVDDGTMDAKDAAGALIALAGLLNEANRVLNGSNVTSSVRVRAFKQGSADFVVDLAQNYGLPAAVAFAPAMHWTAEQVVSFVAGTGKVIWKRVGDKLGDRVAETITDSLWGIEKASEGRAPVKEEARGDGNTHYEFNGPIYGDVNFVTESPKAKLLKSGKIRKHLAQVVEPLEKAGVNGMDVIDGGKVVARITKDDVPIIKAAVGGLGKVVKLKPTRGPTWLQVIGPVFEEKSKWKFKAPHGEEMTVEIPEDYWEGPIKGGERFGHGDALLVDLETNPQMIDGEMRFSHRLHAVLQHYAHGTQRQLGEPNSES
jgi:hypothetical protein